MPVEIETLQPAPDQPQPGPGIYHQPSLREGIGVTLEDFKQKVGPALHDSERAANEHKWQLEASHRNLQRGFVDLVMDRTVSAQDIMLEEAHEMNQEFDKR